MKEMYTPKEIKSYINGVDGTFLMVNDVPTFSDIDTDADLIYLSKAIFHLRRCLEEKRAASKMYVHCQKRNVIFYLDNEYTMAVMVSKNANIHLLHRIVKKILSHVKASVEDNNPKEGAEQKVLTFFS
ncbi:MAG: hypothetical protein HXS48_22265 [Theionarchaea archaeon]|nr:hypothetical protein [Theionarchaea archaeon]